MQINHFFSRFQLLHNHHHNYNHHYDNDDHHRDNHNHSRSVNAVDLGLL